MKPAHKKGKAYHRFKPDPCKRKYKVSNHWGIIPVKLHFCVLCELDEKKDARHGRNLTVHHHKERSKGGKNCRRNLVVLCERHHIQLHHPYMFKRIKLLYAKYWSKRILKG